MTHTDEENFVKRRHSVPAVIAGLALTSTAMVTGLTGVPSLAAGSATVTPATGGSSTASSFETSGPCTDPAATHVYVAIAGGSSSGHLGTTNVVGTAPTTTYTTNASGGYVIPAPQSWRDFFTSRGISQPQGSYTVAVVCRTADDSTSLGSFTQTMQWANGSYSTGGSAPSAPRVITAAHIKGAVKVGNRVECVATFAGASSVKYRWLRNGTLIPKAIKRSFHIPHRLKGKRLSCRAIGKNAVGRTASTSKRMRVRA